VAATVKEQLAEPVVGADVLRSVSQALAAIVRHVANKGEAEVNKWKEIYKHEHRARKKARRPEGCPSLRPSVPPSLRPSFRTVDIVHTIRTVRPFPRFACRSTTS